MEQLNIIGILNITPDEHPKHDQIGATNRKRTKLLIRVFGCFFPGSKTNPVLKKNCDLLDVLNEYFDPS